MKKTSILFLLLATVAFGAANDVVITQRKADNSSFIQRNVAPAATGLLVFDSSFLPTSPAGLTFDAGTGALTATSFVGNTAAGTLTGTTLAANVLTSSLTTVGALTAGSINWAGSIVTSGSITGAAGSFTTLSSTAGLTLNDGSANSPSLNFVTTSGTRTMDMDGSTIRILNLAATNARLQLTDAGNLTVDGSITGGAISGTTGTFSGDIKTTATNIYGGSGNVFGSNLYYSGGWKYGGNGFGVAMAIGGSGESIFYYAANNTGGAAAVATPTAVGTFTSTGLNSTVIGATTPAAGSFTTLGATGAISSTANLSAAFDNPTGTYARWSHNGSAKGDVGTGNQIVSGGSSSDFGITSRAGNLLLGANSTTYATLSTTGLAVTGIISATGDIVSSSGNNSSAFYANGATTGWSALRLTNTGGTTYFGTEASVGGTLVVGSTAYDALIRTHTGLSISTNGGSGTQMRVSPTGLSVTGIITGSVQALSGAGAVDVTNEHTDFTSTGVAQALTLANGVPGQTKTICHVSDGGSAELTPTTKTGFTTITFTLAGDSVTLRYSATGGWYIVGIYGAVAA